MMLIAETNWKLFGVELFKIDLQGCWLEVSAVQQHCKVSLMQHPLTIQLQSFFSLSHTTMAMSYVSPLWFDLQEEFGDLAFGHNASHEMICLPSNRFYCKAACYVGAPSLVGHSMHKSWVTLSPHGSARRYTDLLQRGSLHRGLWHIRNIRTVSKEHGWRFNSGC